MALEDIDQQHLAAVGLDDLVADHLLAGVVSALDQHARLDLGDQLDRRVLFKDHDEIDRLQRSSTSARARSSWTGRPSPFTRRTDASLLMPTTSRSQAPRAAVSTLTW